MAAPQHLLTGRVIPTGVVQLEKILINQGFFLSEWGNFFTMLRLFLRPCSGFLGTRLRICRVLFLLKHFPEVSNFG